jgi:hypothetical protein
MHTLIFRGRAAISPAYFTVLLGLLLGSCAGGQVPVTNPATLTHVSPSGAGPAALPAPAAMSPAGPTSPAAPLPPQTAPAPAMPATPGAATVPPSPPADGLSVALRSDPTLCMGSDAPGAVRVVACTSPQALRLTLSRGQWRSKDNRCLDLSHGALVDGTPLVMAPCAATAASPTQQWSVDKLGYIFFSSAQATSKCVFAAAAGNVAGTALQLAACNTAALQWTVGGEGMEVRLGAGRAACLTDSAAAGNGAAVTVAACHNLPTQRWVLAGGQLRLLDGKAMATCLDINKNTDVGGQVASASLDTWACNALSAEAFLFDGSDGSVRLQSRPTLCAQAAIAVPVGSAPSPVDLGACTPGSTWTLAPLGS